MQKLYYSISEVSELVSEEQHILRYWEKEFDILKPRKNRGGNRIYSERDLQIIKAIKKYIRIDKLSLKGAKEQIIKSFDINQETISFSNVEKPLSSSNVLINNDDAEINKIIDFVGFLKEIRKEIV
jgi:DNA-binding transcriptional MerR regulator